MHKGCVATGFTERCVYMYIYYVYSKLLASYGDTQLCVHSGLRICEVAHDYQVQVSRYVTDELGLLNSYDTWHGKLCIRNVLLVCVSLSILYTRDKERGEGVTEDQSGFKQVGGSQLVPTAV